MRYLSMEYAPLRRKGKGGEVPQLHRRFLAPSEPKTARALACGSDGNRRPKAWENKISSGPSYSYWIGWLLCSYLRMGHLEIRINLRKKSKDPTRPNPPLFKGRLLKGQS